MFAQLISIWSEALAWVWLASIPKQAALVFGVALALRCWPRLAAAWRHWVWLAAALAVGFVPLAASVLPRWPVIPAEWVFGAAVTQATQVEAQQLLEVSRRSIQEHETFAASWLEGVFVVWCIGVLFLTLRLGAGLVGLRSFQRERLPVCTGRLCARLEACRKRAGVHTLVDLYLSRRSPLPMTWGVVRPAINLPMEAEEWSDERLDAVFLHELGHIHRADCWTNMVLKLVCAFHWFNPLVWMAARRTYLAQEVACDDFACERLRPSDYARHLLELTAIVKEVHRREIEPAVGLASCDHLRLRVAAALDPERSRRALPSRNASLISGGVFVCMGGLAMMSLRFVEESRAALGFGPGAAPLEGVWSTGEGDLASGWAWLESEEALSDLTKRELGMTPSLLAFAPAWMAGVPHWNQGPSAGITGAGSMLGEDGGVLPEVESGEIGTGMRGEGQADASPSARPQSPGPGAKEESRPRPLPGTWPSEGFVAGALPPPVPLKASTIPRPPLSASWKAVDWGSFQRRAGERRGRSAVLGWQESVCNRYSRLSPSDRARAGSFPEYLRRAGIHLDDAGIAALIARTKNRGR